MSHAHCCCVPNPRDSACRWTGARSCSWRDPRESSRQGLPHSSSAGTRPSVSPLRLCLPARRRPNVLCGSSHLLHTPNRSCSNKHTPHQSRVSHARAPKGRSRAQPWARTGVAARPPAHGVCTSRGGGGVSDTRTLPEYPRDPHAMQADAQLQGRPHSVLVHMWCLIARPLGRCWVCVCRWAGGHGGGGGAGWHSLRGGSSGRVDTTRCASVAGPAVAGAAAGRERMG
jgi:hypothetical protein